MVQGKVEVGAVTAVSLRASVMVTSSLSLRAVVSAQGGGGSSAARERGTEDDCR